MKTDAILQKEIWNKNWSKDDVRYLTNSFSNRCYKKIQNYYVYKIKLLDIGCGLGSDSIYFAKNGLNVTSFDFSESAINIVFHKSFSCSHSFSFIRDTLSNYLKSFVSSPLSSARSAILCS